MNHLNVVQSDRYRADEGPKTNDEHLCLRAVQVGRTPGFVIRLSSFVALPQAVRLPKSRRGLSSISIRSSASVIPTSRIESSSLAKPATTGRPDDRKLIVDGKSFGGMLHQPLHATSQGRKIAGYYEEFLFCHAMQAPARLFSLS